MLSRMENETTASSAEMHRVEQASDQTFQSGAREASRDAKFQLHGPLITSRRDNGYAICPTCTLPKEDGLVNQIWWRGRGEAAGRQRVNSRVSSLPYTTPVGVR